MSDGIPLLTVCPADSLPADHRKTAPAGRGRQVPATITLATNCLSSAVYHFDEFYASPGHIGKKIVVFYL